MEIKKKCCRKFGRCFLEEIKGSFFT